MELDDGQGGGYGSWDEEDAAEVEVLREEFQSAQRQIEREIARGLHGQGGSTQNRAERRAEKENSQPVSLSVFGRPSSSIQISLLGHCPSFLTTVLASRRRRWAQDREAREGEAKVHPTGRRNLYPSFSTNALVL